jgi:cytochrome c
MPMMNIQLTTIVRHSGLVLATVAALLLSADAVADEKKTTGDAPPQASDTMHGEMMGGEMMMPGAQGLMMPAMDPARGRELFASKGCVTCHSINGVGGEDATPLDAHTMQSMMNPFDFAAKMWRMAPAMIAAQEEALGEQIEFTGQELADIIAFVHHDAEQHHFSESDIPPEIMPMMHHMHGGEGGAAAHAEELGHMHEAGEEHND